MKMVVTTCWPRRDYVLIFFARVNGMSGIPSIAPKATSFTPQFHLQEFPKVNPIVFYLYVPWVDVDQVRMDTAENLYMVMQTRRDPWCRVRGWGRDSTYSRLIAEF